MKSSKSKDKQRPLKVSVREVLAPNRQHDRAHRTMIRYLKRALLEGTLSIFEPASCKKPEIDKERVKRLA